MKKAAGPRQLRLRAHAAWAECKLALSPIVGEVW